MSESGESEEIFSLAVSHHEDANIPDPDLAEHGIPDIPEPEREKLALRNSFGSVGNGSIRQSRVFSSIGNIELDTVLTPMGKFTFTKCKEGLLTWAPNRFLYRTILYITIPILVWISAALIVGPSSLPGGGLFPLIILEFCGLGLGFAVQALRLPPLLGMLTMGLMIRNVPFIDFGKDLTPTISSPLRQIALIVILIRAGLGLDPGALIRLKGVVLRLAFIPCLCEALTIGVVTHLILDFPWAWGFLLGFVMAAVSPAVVVPCLLSLRERGYGIEKGIPTIVIAAASLDDILAISCFGFTLTFALSRQEHWTQSLIQGPLEIIFGLLFGIIWGMGMGLLLTLKDEKGDGNTTMIRAFFLLSGGILSVFGFQYIEYPGAGCLGCLASTFLAAVVWREKSVLGDSDILCWTFSVLWFFFQPLLFGLIGSELDLNLMDTKVVGLGLLCLFIGLIIRLGASYLAVSGSNLSVQERIFIAIAWVPKATVQAAIGPIALDAARKIGAGQEAEDLGLQVLTLAVLGILITAPIGASILMLTGPKLLSPQRQKSPDPDQSSTTPRHHV